jgi:polar amino acid transport system substrate-binding protein
MRELGGHVYNKFLLSILLSFTLSLNNIFASNESESNLAKGLKKLVVIAEASYPPITFINDKGEGDGLALEVAKCIFKKLNINKNIRLYPWSRAYKSLNTVPHCVVFSVARTKQRESMYQWVGPIYYMKTSFYVKKKSDIVIKSLDDARLVPKIGAYYEAYDEQYLRGLGFNNLEATTNNILNVKKLMNGRFNMITATNVTIGSILKEAGYKKDDIKGVYNFLNVGVYFAFSKDVPFEVVVAWRRALEDMKDDGTLQKIRKKWLGDF